jgi:chromosome segregation ATPase
VTPSSSVHERTAGRELPPLTRTNNAEEPNVLEPLLVRANRAVERQRKATRKAKDAAAEAHQQLEEVREELEQLQARLEKAERDVQQYRNWWLNEVQFTKLILNKVPNANQDWDLVRTSQSHYLGRF